MALAAEMEPDLGCTAALSIFRCGSLSCQSFGPQPFEVFAQRFLLLLVFGQGPIRWTEYIVDVILPFAHDVTLSNCRVPARLSQMGIAIRNEKRPAWGLGGGGPGPPGHFATNGGIRRRSATG